MNYFRAKPFSTVVGRLAMLLAIFVFLQASGEEPPVHSRWLLVFDTSSTMKKLLPGTEAALRNLFSTGADGQLQAGDSVAVWLVDQKINGQCPTFAVGATNAGTVLSNLVVFLHRQQYASPSQLGVLQSPLNHVVAGSRRLTVVLFTDGQSEISGTPYDDGVNQTFHDVQADRRKNQQPVVVALRSQMGKFAGCTLAFPPADISFPPFPDLPKPPPAATSIIKATNPTEAHPPVATSLVMVGNQVITNSNSNFETHAVPAAPVTVSNPPPATPASNVTATNLPPPAAPLPAPAASSAKVETQPVPTPTNVTKTAPVVIPPAFSVPPSVPSNPPPPVAVITPAVPAPTNPPAPVAVVTQNIAKPLPLVMTNNTVVAAMDFPGGGTRSFVYAVIGVLAVMVMVFFLIRISRRPQASLISRSMQDERQGK